jgi:hypothetical protein
MAATIEAPIASPSTAATGTAENLYLLGRPPLKEFLHYVRTHAVHPPGDGELLDQWRAAHQLIQRLQTEEAGRADDPPIGKLGPDWESLLIPFLKDPLVRHGFNTVPTEVALVELDRLVVYQEHIDVTFARDLEQRLGPVPSREALFRTCLPFDHPQPPVQWSRVRKDKYVFCSPSNDMRFLGAMPLDPDNIKDYPPPGSLVGVVGIAVGFGSNFLNAIYAERRLILNNGSHRAYALRRMGVTHVPCIVQHVASRDELELVASSRVRNAPDEYLKQARPSMLPDYLHPELRLVMPVHRRMRQVTVKFEVEEDYVPALEATGP